MPKKQLLVNNTLTDKIKSIQITIYLNQAFV